MAGGRVLTFQLPDPFFHLLAGLERDHVFLGHEHLVAGAGVAGLAGGPPLHLEDAEIAKLDAALRHQGLDDGVEGLLHDFLRLQLGQPDFLGNGSTISFLVTTRFSSEKGRPQAE